jgi:hypothetical protein
MKRSPISISVLAALVCILIAERVSAQPYRGVVLYEVDFAVQAVYGGQAVGWTNYGSSDSLDPIDPLLANAPTGDVVFLSPAARRMDNRTFVADTDGVQQVGAGTFHTANPYISANQHAFLWTGTAESVVDLNPPGAAGSVPCDAVAWNGGLRRRSAPP